MDDDENKIENYENNENKDNDIDMQSSFDDKVFEISS